MARVLQQLRRAGLKVKIKNSSFFSPELEYLVCFLTKEGIKLVPVQKKIEGVFDPQSSTNCLERAKKLLGDGTFLQRYM